MYLAKERGSFTNENVIYTFILLSMTNQINFKRFYEIRLFLLYLKLERVDYSRGTYTFLRNYYILSPKFKEGFFYGINKIR